MNEERSPNYLNLIDALLSCPSGEEWKVLSTNQHLIDAGLVQMITQVAEVLRRGGERNAADFLFSIARPMAEALGFSSPTSQFTFLCQILQATQQSNGNPQVVYPLLQANLDKLDDSLVQVLQSVIANLPTEDLEKAKQIAGAIGDFSTLMAQFPLGNRAGNLEIAITGYEVVATVFTHDRFPQAWALNQNNLGNAYSDRIRGERVENLEQAINCYERALQVYTRDAFPEDWAMLQNNLCNTYGQRLRGERAKNLEQAIDYCKNALLVRTSEAFPEYWADSQINLGNAFSLRLLGERAENLEKAIHCYKEALQVYTRDEFPEDWATIQSNLGAAYLYRIHGERVENLEKAIHCYEKALQVRTRQTFPDKWAETQNNLGETFRKPIWGQHPENLKRAIVCYEKALQVYTRDAFPEQWAMTQNNLGEAYRTSFWEERTNNLEQAIRCYEKVLEVYTYEAFPERWATTQNNLAAAYGERVCGSRAENLERAIAHFQNALQVHTRDSFPQYHAETQLNLGVAYQDAGQFPNAHTAFKIGINTVESLRSEIISGSGNEQAKQKLAEEYNKLYQHMVEVCLELAKEEPKYYAQALEYAEHSKTRNLVELILTRDIHAVFPPEIVSQLEQLRDKIASNQYQLQTATAENPTSLAQHLQQLRQQRNELQDRYLAIGYGFKFDQFQAILDNHTAIIQWYITRSGFETFIITRHNIQRLILSTPAGELNDLINWANEYLEAYTQAKTQWINTLAYRLSRLAEILHLEDILKLVPDTCSRLILIPHRYLHLFPLHALPLANGDFLCDRFPNGVSYAPSCQLLQLTQKRERPDFSNFFAIQNPTDDLLYTNLEVETIRSSFPSAQVLVKQAATKTALKASQDLPLAHCNHFCCHGEFNLTSPLESALLLANKERLTLGEIFGLNLKQCRLVTLSACETGLSDPTSVSDEYISLPSGFLYAGSPSVVSSLWKAQDFSTAFLMIRFYENLSQIPKLEEGTVAIALNQAQQWLRNLTTEEFEKLIDECKLQIEQIFSQLPERKYRIFHASLKQARKRKPYPFANPYYWAAFTATGI
jgi:CHAT domain-containing protein